MKKAMVVAAVIALLVVGAWAQVPTGTAHGITASSTPATTDTGGNPITITGMNFYVGNTATGPFTPATSSPVPVTTQGVLYSLFIAASAFVPGNTYFFCATDLAGPEESACSAVTSVVATFPASPKAPASGPTLVVK